MNFRLTIIVFFIVFSTLTISASTDDTVETVDQTPFQVKVLNSSLIIEFNTTVNFYVNVTLNSNPVVDARFDFPDISLDIAESQQYIDQGMYNITLFGYATFNILPGNYSSNLRTVVLDDEVLTSIDFSVINDDTEDPELTIISPNFSDGYNETNFLLILEGRDNRYWKSISVNLGGNSLLYIENRGGVFLGGGLAYNSTYFSIDQWIDLQGIAASLSNTLTLTLTDFAFNTDIKSFQLSGDYIAPKVEFTSHGNQQRIYNRTITLSWTIEDDSDIDKIDLFLNNALFKPNDELIPSSARSVTFFVPIPVEDATVLIFQIVITDSFGNRGKAVIELIYDSSSAAGQVLGFEFGSQTQFEMARTLIATISLTIIIIILSLIFINRLKNRGKSTKLSTKKADSFLNASYYYFLLDGIIDNIDLIERFHKQVEVMLSKYSSKTINLATKIKTDMADYFATLEISYNQFMMIDANLNELLT